MTDQTPANPAWVLNLPMPLNDAGADTIRDYLIELLSKVWDHVECFDGKRPFGNSGWEYELYPPLITAGLLDGAFDEDGDIERVDVDAARRVIAAAIRALR